MSRRRCPAGGAVGAAAADAPAFLRVRLEVRASESCGVREGPAGRLRGPTRNVAHLVQIVNKPASLFRGLVRHAARPPTRLPDSSGSLDTGHGPSTRRGPTCPYPTCLQAAHAMETHAPSHTCCLQAAHATCYIPCYMLHATCYIPLTTCHTPLSHMPAPAPPRPHCPQRTPVRSAMPLVCPAQRYAPACPARHMPRPAVARQLPLHSRQHRCRCSAA